MEEQSPSPASGATARVATIALLDPLVANQIAAGEVVERPSSVVKELVENALDAQATRVEVHLHDGGKASIEIRDDGHGIAADQAALAFVRHATSKIRNADELSRVASYGFRGEALASIAAVARVRLETRTHSEEIGVLVEIAGAAAATVRRVSCARGTRITIADLFFNVPARAAFLRTAATELGHIIRLIEQLALARPELALLLTHNGRKVSDFPARADLAARVADVVGADVAAHLHAIDAIGPYAVTGRLSEPGHSRGSPSALTLVVDGRPVRDRLLSNAVVAAYGEALERGRHPVGVLHLHAPPGSVDVNVHPAKAEVRFASSRAVHAAVAGAIGAMLAAQPWRHEEDDTPHPPARSTPPPAPRPTAGGEPADAWRFATPTSWRTADRDGQRARTWAPQAGESAAMTSAAMTSAAMTSAAMTSQAPLFGRAGFQNQRYLGQAASSALVFADGDHLILADAHALHETVLAVDARAALHGRALPRTELVVARLVALPQAAVAAIRAATTELASLGFAVALAGERAVLVRSYPTAIAASRVEIVVAAIADALVVANANADIDGKGGADLRSANVNASVAAAFACSAAIAPGEAVGTRWVESLIAAAADLDLDAMRVHGRRILRRFDAAAIEALLSTP